MPEGIYNSMLVAFLLLKLSLFDKTNKAAKVSTIRINESDLNLQMAQKEIVETLTTHRFFQQSYDVQDAARAGKKKSKTVQDPPPIETNVTAKNQILRLADNPGGKGVYNQVIFLSPEQSLVWECPLKVQSINGFATSGKTVLIQQKALELLQIDGDDGAFRVLILVPNTLRTTYAAYFNINLTNYC